LKLIEICNLGEIKYYFSGLYDIWCK
jgi:hypothetical protein